MNAVALLEKYFSQNRISLEIVLEHSRMVADKALSVVRLQTHTELDLQFIEEAAMLHDIGVSGTYAPRIGCYGNEPYIRHGVLGREILDAEGFPAHALVCERHIGVGLTVQDIIEQQLGIPERNMEPVTRAERIICFADLFYSKRLETIRCEKTVDQVKKNLLKHGGNKIAVFEKWLEEFGGHHAI
jgi:uncharacterized protein